MGTTDDMVSDAELMLNYAAANKIALPAGCATELIASKGKSAELAVPGKSRDDFYAAFDAAATVLNVSVASIRASTGRCDRLRPLLDDALQLLEFAAANAKQIEDDIRDPLLAAADALSKGTPTLADEQAFMKAYQALTVKTAPVTADTLDASKTKLPDLTDFFSRERFADAFRGLTIGRFVNAWVFLFFLIITCVSLSYYSLGSTGLARYHELHAFLSKTEAELPLKRDLVALRESAVKKEEAKVKREDEALAAANRNFVEAQRVVTADEASVREARAEHDAIPDRLWTWSQQPCESRGKLVTAYPFYWTLCSAIDKVPDGVAAPNALAKLEAARTVAARLSEIYLPLLLGWLGAYAFILRKMTKEISENSFAKSSFLRHIVRLGLGALAGFVSTWLLTPEVVGGEALKRISAWGLAFIAGYGIELIFAFMDRIINAFTTKTN
ncbi:hypothetical protein [Candidatus Nitrotoga sp. 1052]|uniref:hypothetical protein n=1 Tax=Candidatus Nitrotoga sp. 1052 TaxID=2886964 RepID=UPI001EF61680|nr:hypothetical protein [Candidatus Nitrotoga sp. 1052]CAH1081241.1 conserved membrane hypothetical protein [Candidatus Nitrotoga sp. 1052]